MASTDANPIPKKNIACRVTFPIYDTSGALVIGAAGLDSEVSKDAGSFADCTNEATEIAQGIYYLDLTATEMNADTVAVIVKTSTTNAIPPVIVLYPADAADIAVNVVDWKGTTAPDMTGDAYARLGAPAGASISADVAAVKSDSAAILVDTGTSGVIVASIANNAVTAAALASDAGTEIATAVWANGTRTLSAGTNIVLAKGTGVTGFTDLDAAGVRTAIGLAAANLDMQLAGLGSDISSLNDLDFSAVQSAAAAALTAYDPPTNAEMEARTLTSTTYATASALTALSAKLPTALASGLMVVDVKSVNGIAVGGAGTEGSPWGPAA